MVDPRIPDLVYSVAKCSVSRRVLSFRRTAARRKVNSTIPAEECKEFDMADARFMEWKLHTAFPSMFSLANCMPMLHCNNLVELNFN